MKVHLKLAARNHLALCGVWPEKNWRTIDAILHAEGNSTCQLCLKAAAEYRAAANDDPLPRPDKTQHADQ